MTLLFKYINVPRQDGTVKKAPYIPIYVRTNNGKVLLLPALIDSGADYSVIPKNVSMLLGLNEGKTTTSIGIGGSVKCCQTSLTFTIQGEHEKYSLSVPAFVIQDEHVRMPILLGRNEFFDNFHITFKQDILRLNLKKIN